MNYKLDGYEKKFELAEIFQWPFIICINVSSI